MKNMDKKEIKELEDRGANNSKEQESSSEKENYPKHLIDRNKSKKKEREQDIDLTM